MESLMVDNQQIRQNVQAAYSEEAVVASHNLGCGNPAALAALKPGEVVLDLGSGAGFDALTAAPQLGDEGRFIGVDMTPAMLASARRNAVNAGLERTVEFREGLLEDLPVASKSVDAIISNCVVNLSPDKPSVFVQMRRVLKPGGRIAISDIALLHPLPDDVKAVEAGYYACVTGALTLEEYQQQLEAAGFVDIKISTAPIGCIMQGAMQDPIMKNLAEAVGPERLLELAEGVVSANIEARSPS